MMSRFFVMLFLCLFLVSCKDDGSASDCVSSAATENQEAGTGTDCVITTDPVTGQTTGTTTGGTTGTTTGSTTGGTTTGGTTGTSTGTTSGGTTTGGSTGTGLPNAAYTFDSNIKFINTSVTQQEKFDKAIEIIKKVVATEEFRSKVLNHTYNGVKTFVDNDGFSNAQIYQKILDGSESLQPTKNNTMDMEVELYYAATTTVGYTYPNTKRIWVNTKYFNTNSVEKVASNLMHEWLHKVGFGHAQSYSTSRDYSVPYAIGRMISSLGTQFN